MELSTTIVGNRSYFSRLGLPYRYEMWRGDAVLNGLTGSQSTDKRQEQRKSEDYLNSSAIQQGHLVSSRVVASRWFRCCPKRGIENYYFQILRLIFNQICFVVISISLLLRARRILCLYFRLNQIPHLQQGFLE